MIAQDIVSLIRENDLNLTIYFHNIRIYSRDLEIKLKII